MVIKSKYKNELKERLALKNSNSRAADRLLAATKVSALRFSEECQRCDQEKALPWFLMASQPLT